MFIGGRTTDPWYRDSDQVKIHRGLSAVRTSMVKAIPARPGIVVRRIDRQAFTASVSLVRSIAYACLVCDPVHFPGLAAILGV